MLCEIDILSETDVAVLVSRAGRALRQAAVPEVEVGRLLTVCSELARNIARYGNHGVVTLDVGPHDGGLRAVIEANDQGPGIADIDAALRDHYSTGGTLGLGLPGVRRMMDVLRIESKPGKGTRVRVEHQVVRRNRAR